jgi:hypothetical protein
MHKAILNIGDVIFVDCAFKSRFLHLNLVALGHE